MMKEKNGENMYNDFAYEKIIWRNRKDVLKTGFELEGIEDGELSYVKIKGRDFELYKDELAVLVDYILLPSPQNINVFKGLLRKNGLFDSLLNIPDLFNSSHFESLMECVDGETDAETILNYYLENSMDFYILSNYDFYIKKIFDEEKYDRRDIFGAYYESEGANKKGNKVILYSAIAGGSALVLLTVGILGYVILEKKRNNTGKVGNEYTKENFLNEKNRLGVTEEEPTESGEKLDGFQDEIVDSNGEEEENKKDKRKELMSQERQDNLAEEIEQEQDEHTDRRFPSEPEEYEYEIPDWMEKSFERGNSIQDGVYLSEHMTPEEMKDETEDASMNETTDTTMNESTDETIDEAIDVTTDETIDITTDESIDKSITDAGNFAEDREKNTDHIRSSNRGGGQMGGAGIAAPGIRIPDLQNKSSN